MPRQPVPDDVVGLALDVPAGPDPEATVLALQQERRRLRVLSEAGSRLARSLRPRSLPPHTILFGPAASARRRICPT